MAQLHNRVSNDELKQRMLAETEPRITISFYQYFPIEDPQAFRDQWYVALHALQVFGRVYVAHEGINAQVSVPESQYAALKTFLYSHEPLDGIRLNVAVDDDGKSFWVLRIKVRDKIVADGIDDPQFSMTRKGAYLKAPEFNALATDPETIIVDMRNHYEYEVGHFKQAIEVPADTFREQLPMAVEMLKDAKEKNIVMYCTGGIRCEKASAYLLHHGFKNVFHLEGGIIHYSNQAKALAIENRFIGKNFVFDERLGERITPDVIAHCHQCGAPCDVHVNCANDHCHLLFIQCDHCKEKYSSCCSAECAEVKDLSKEEKAAWKKKQHDGQNIFNKSKQRLRPRLNDADKE